MSVENHNEYLTAFGCLQVQITLACLRGYSDFPFPGRMSSGRSDAKAAKRLNILICVSSVTVVVISLICIFAIPGGVSFQLG